MHVCECGVVSTQAKVPMEAGEYLELELQVVLTA